MVGNGMGAKNGILFKNAVSLEEAGKVQVVALDKTGTITSGEPEVTDLIPAAQVTERELLEMAYQLEKQSEHPLAKAINRKAEAEQIPGEELEEFHALLGNGLEGLQKGQALLGGSIEFIKTKAELSSELEEAAKTLAEAGKTPLAFAKDGVLQGIIGVADVIKEDSPQAINELKNMGIHVVMLTGDNERTAKAIGAQAGVDEVIAGVLPDGKERVIRDLKRQGKVAMVGDGINDAPALTRADLGIAIGAGTDIAMDAADVVLMKSRLSDVPAAIRLSRATLRNIHENLFWAFIYNIIGIPLAAGVWIPLFGWKLNPMFGAAAMSLSSFCVVSNALRLNLFDIRSTKKDRKRVSNASNVSKGAGTNGDMTEKGTGSNEKTDAKGSGPDGDMTETGPGQNEKIIQVKGMMCGHCEAHVKKALEELPEVEEATADFQNGVAKVVLNAEVDDRKLKQAIEKAGYKMIRVK